MIKIVLIILFLYSIFYIARKIIFLKKREFKFLRKPALKNYFLDYFYFQSIKKDFKYKKYFFILDENTTKIIEKLTPETNKIYNFPKESLFSAIFVNNTSYIILNTEALSQERNPEMQALKRRFIRLLKRIRKNNNFYLFKGILSFKDNEDISNNKNNPDELNAIVFRDYFVLSELNGIYKAEIPYYSLLELPIKGNYSDIISDFKIKDNTKIVGFCEYPFHFENSNIAQQSSDKFIENYKRLLDFKKFNVVQQNLDSNEIRKYIGIVSSLKNGVSNCHKNYNYEIEKNLEKYKINLCSAGMFFYHLDHPSMINIESLLKEISESQFENIRLNNNRFNKYQNVIVAGAGVAGITTVALGVGLTDSLISFHKEYDKISNINNKIKEYNSLSDLGKNSKITNISCEIINDAYHLSRMDSNYTFIIPSWSKSSSSSIQEQYSTHFSKFFNKNLIHSFNKYVNDTVVITAYDDISNFSNHDQAYAYASDNVSRMSRINNIYSKLNHKDSDSFSDSINQMLQTIYGTDSNLTQCNFDFKSNAKIATLQSKNLKLELEMSHDAFQKKSKDKFDKVLEILVTSQFNKKKLDAHAYSMNKLFSTAFKIEQPNFNSLSNEEKFKFIKQIVADYLALKEFASITSQTTKSVDEFINTNHYNVLYTSLQNASIISKKDIDFYKKRIEDIFKDFKDIMLTYQIKEFDQKLFLIELDKSVVIHKDIDFYFSHLSKIISDHTALNPSNEHSLEALNEIQYFNIEFLQTVLNNTINLDNIIKSFKDKKYTPNLQNKIESTLKFIVELHLINNKNKLFTSSYRSNLNTIENSQDDHVKNLVESYQVIKQMNTFVTKYQLSQIAQTIFPFMYSKINHNFQTLKGKLVGAGLYAGTTSNFNWWNGESPAAQRYFAVSTEAELSEYLQKQKGIILKIYNDQVSPLMTIHEELNLSFKDSSEIESREFWKRIKIDLIEKSEVGSISSLNDFILNSLNKTVTETCYKYLKSIQINRRNDEDYFDVIKYNLANKFGNRCQSLYYERSIIEYNLISKMFNQKLSNKFPFIETNKISQMGQYALLDDVKSFMQSYLVFAKSYLSFLKEYYPSFFKPEYKDFIQKTNKFYSFMASGKDSDGKIKFPVEFFFRADRQNEINGNKILNWKLECGAEKFGSNHGTQEEARFKWTFGDPCKLSFKISKSKTSKVTNNDIQNIVSDENNPWGMLALIMRYRDCKDGCDNSNKLKMNLINSNGENAILFNFNYKLFKNNSLNEQIAIPKFPVFAPEVKDQSSRVSQDESSELPDI